MMAVALLPFRIVGYLLRVVFDAALRAVVTMAVLFVIVLVAFWWLNNE